MPRYFFTTRNGQEEHTPHEGLELENDRAAWEEATVACGEILKHIDGKLKPNQEWRMDVNDDDHDLIFSLRLIPEVYRRFEP